MSHQTNPYIRGNNVKITYPSSANARHKMMTGTIDMVHQDKTYLVTLQNAEKVVCDWEELTILRSDKTANQ